MTSERVPVVIVGAGPTGVTAAIMLSRRGIQCLLLERWPDVYPLPRAVHFDDEVFRVFAALGLEQQLRQLSRPVRGMRLTDARHTVLAEFNRDPAHQPHGFPQANMFNQPDLERLLRAELARYPGIELRAGAEVTGIANNEDNAQAALVRYREVASGAEHEVWADAVLGCDGANSVIRDAIGASMEDFDFAQQWLVVDVDSPMPLACYDGVQQVCDAAAAATFMPVTPGRYRWEFRLRPGTEPHDIDDEQVRHFIEPWLDDVDAATLTIVRRSIYTFRGVVADRWRRGRVFLLGDAAHQTPPFIGQGMCAGIRDAQNLAWKLALVLGGAADARLLDTYEAERRPYARRVVRLAIALGWVMTGGTARTATARRAALRTLTRFPGVEDRVLNAAWPAFRDGPLAHRRNRTCPAGRLSPQPILRHKGQRSPLDRLLGDGFAIVYRGADRLRSFDTATRLFFERLGAAVLRVEDVPDDDGALHQLLDDLRAEAVLLRPDRVVAASSDIPDLRAWRRQLADAGITPRPKEGNTMTETALLEAAS